MCACPVGAESLLCSTSNQNDISEREVSLRNGKGRRSGPNLGDTDSACGHQLRCIFQYDPGWIHI